ncbi:DUF3108 domain-containing protein [bacterium SCSIO 12696]|nr:DUF3108 domain-containing protein [bacterium SCSIO 12696]
MKQTVTTLALWLLLSSTLFAEQQPATNLAPEAPAITPFTATYGAKYKGMKLKAVRTLEPTENGHYRINSKASHVFFGSIKESSEFTLHEGRIRPLDYRMSRRILGIGKKESATFNWQQQLATSTYKSKSTELSLTGTELDWLGYQVQISRDLQAGADELHYQIVRRGEIKAYSFKVVGEETIDTPAGAINTVKLERINDPNKRQTTFWMAPEYDYLLVKFHRVENDGDEYALSLRSVKMAETTE